jgi:hypothetical protein
MAIDFHVIDIGIDSQPITAKRTGRKFRKLKE